MSELGERLVGRLSRAVGEVAARRALEEVTLRLGHDPSGLERRHALEVLEELAQQPGILGTTALFAKSRIYLG